MLSEMSSPYAPGLEGVPAVDTPYRLLRCSMRLWPVPTSHILYHRQPDPFAMLLQQCDW